MQVQNPKSVLLDDVHQLANISFVVPVSVAREFQDEAFKLLTRVVAMATPTDFEIGSFDTSSFDPPFGTNRRGDEDAWSLPPLTDADGPAACWVVDNWTETGRRLAAGLLTHPGGIRSRDLADSAHFGGGISSAMRHVAGRLRAIDRRPFWNGDPASKGHERGQRLWCDTDSEAYKLIRSIFEARYPDVLATMAVN